MPIASQQLPVDVLGSREGVKENSDVNDTAERFINRFKGHEEDAEGRKAETSTMVNEYYDLVTDFYEYGWGQYFHFAPRYKGEGFLPSLARHEAFLALQGEFTRDKRILDIGCGVGGPARNIARLTCCKVTGINNNAYQIGRAQGHDRRLGLEKRLNYVKTDFCHMPFGDSEYDGAYAIEATCHATDKVECFSEIFRVLKPGATFVSYEWCTTDLYDSSNAEHRAIRQGIELGDGLPLLEGCDVVVAALKKSGFIVEDSFDLIKEFEACPVAQIPWYQPLQADYTSLNGLKATPIGRTLTNVMCRTLELLHLAPKGTSKTTDILEAAAVNLVKGGQLGIFTPAFFVKARKPAA